MIYVEHDDVPYLVTDIEESLNFLRNIISMHCIDNDDTVYHLIKTGIKFRAIKNPPKRRASNWIN